MAKLRVKLGTTTNRSFAGHQVIASYLRKITISGESLYVREQTSVLAEAAGQAVLELPSKESFGEDKTIQLKVLSPDGQLLKVQDTSANMLDGEQPIEVKVDPKEFFPIQANTDPAYLKPDKIRGMVVDPSGKSNLTDRQIILRAKPASPAEAPLGIVAVARTDKAGYFSAPFPLGNFKEAQGSITGSDQTILVRLNDDGSFPDRVVLGLDRPLADGQEKGVECDCAMEPPRNPDAEDLVNSTAYSSDGGHCVDITTPNRVLEEFDYYAVVRTTEPAIKGLTIKDPPKVGLDDIIRIIDPKLSAVALSAQPVDAASQPATAAPEARRMVAMDSATLVRSQPELGFEMAHLAETANSIRTIRAVRDAATASAGTADATRPAGEKLNLKDVQINAEIAKTLTYDPDGFTLTKLATAEMMTRKQDLVRVIDLIRRREPGRDSLSCANPLDWDDEPTFYQACTIAHGHILHFKQQWVADGFSMGDLLYSLPLAPCQKKQIAVIDWDRRESAARRESLEEQEFLNASLSRDRDISEVANAVVRENTSGGSNADTGSFGGGLGIGLIIPPVGGLLGIGGGTSSASSSAWQNSSRSTSASSLQSLRDRTMQASSAVRSQRSTVIQTVRQGETMRVETEVVANHNHCHAITIQYFEVLRHFLVKQNVVDVQECLLVPMLISRFDSAKARRWRETLGMYVRNPALRRGFDALQRIADNYVGSDMPTGSYAQEELQYLDGFLRISFRIQRPRDDTDGKFLETSWAPLLWLGITPHEWWSNHLESQKERDRVFAQVLGPKIAEEITNGLRFYAVDENDNETPLPIDATLVSDFANDRPLYVSLRLRADLPPLRRERIKFIKIATTIDTKAGPKNIDDILPVGSKVIVDSGQMAYRTQHLSYNLFSQSRILNDLSGTDGVMIYTPLSRQELRRPREEDKELANTLLKHLNDHLEYFHRAIWWRMDAQRRFMLLDGFIAPNSGGRSVASVVENRLTGIIGNCLVMPVARGFHLDPTFKQDAENPIDLLDHYQPNTPIAPLRIAIPTKGVFAESVMGACNSCEKKDESRFWRWEESPCGDEPTLIQPVSTESRRAEPPSMTPKDFPAPIVAFQNVPPAPDPQGFGGLLNLLSNPNLFRDITGLTENQKNALAALQSALSTAQFFGGKAADLALQGSMNKDIDKALDKINEQHKAGAISDQQRQQLTEAALRSMIGGGTSKAAEPMSTKQVESLANTAGANAASLKVSRPGGEQVEVDARPTVTTASLSQPLEQACGFFGSNVVINEQDLRDAIAAGAVAERGNWLDSAGKLLKEDEDSQFGQLTKYWLGSKSAILPTTLGTLQANAANPATNYGQLINNNATAAAVATEAQNVRATLLNGAPDATKPANLNSLVEQALTSARFSRLDDATRGPWSAVFVTSVVRDAAIQLGLESLNGSTHVGRDELLVGTSAHRVYVLEAYNNRFGGNPKKGTYHAFRPNERTPQVGDIIVQDRQVSDINNVVEFDDIPTTLNSGYALHGDIVVEVPDGADYVIAIGGNLGNSAKRRRYPLDANRRLVVDRTQLYTQENDNGNLPNVPATDNSPGLNTSSTGRIFALLSLVQQCAAIPGQKVDGGVLV